jgi:RimJ/RimL family protein N-acetyltransferase
VDTQSDEIVGIASIRFEGRPERRDGLLGVVIKKSMWGKGYGTELVGWVVQHSFKFLGLHRVSLEVFPANIGAIALYSKMYVYFSCDSMVLANKSASGFVQEGIRRHARFYDGRWDDIILMGILEDEFFVKNTHITSGSA